MNHAPLATELQHLVFDEAFLSPRLFLHTLLLETGLMSI